MQAASYKHGCKSASSSTLFVR